MTLLYSLPYRVVDPCILSLTLSGEINASGIVHGTDKKAGTSTVKSYLIIGPYIVLLISEIKAKQSWKSFSFIIYI